MQHSDRKKMVKTISGYWLSIPTGWIFLGKKRREAKKYMNGLQQIKEAKKAVPMAVMVVKNIPKECRRCDFSIWEFYPETATDELVCLNGFKAVPRKGRSESCEIRKAIGLVNPDGHIDYFQEVK